MSNPAAALRKLYTLEPGTRAKQVEPAYDFHNTPNKSARAYGPTDTIVVHCTAGGSTSGAIGALTNPDREASAHIIIPDYPKSGEPVRTVRLVHDTLKAWHVRKSVLFQGKTDINSRSFGMEIVNTAMEGDGYSDFQYELAAQWTAWWIATNPIRFIVTHAYCDPARRSDPCITFDWDRYIKDVEKLIKEPDRTPLKIVLDAGPGNKTEIDADAEIVDGATWAELRPVAEALGYSIAYSGPTHTVTLQKREP